MVEMLEDRRVLPAAVPPIEVFSTSPALFVENQGQWADQPARFLHSGSGANNYFIAPQDQWRANISSQQPSTGTPACVGDLPKIDPCGDITVARRP